MTTLDPTIPAGAQATARLRDDVVGWLTTINPDGQPQSSPVWFLWDGREVFLYSHKRAARNGNIADRPLVAFNLNTDATGDEVLTMEGEARFDPDGVRASANAPYLAKYGSRIAGYGWSVEQFETDYPHVIRITPTRWRV